MVSLRFLCSLLVAGLTWRACAGEQAPFPPPGSDLPAFRQTDSLLSPQLLSYIDEVRRNGSIPGISIGVVRLGEDSEPIVQLAASGRKMEEGNGRDLTPDVRSLRLPSSYKSETVRSASRPSSA